MGRKWPPRPGSRAAVDRKNARIAEAERSQAKTQRITELEQKVRELRSALRDCCVRWQIVNGHYEGLACELCGATANDWPSFKHKDDCLARETEEDNQ